MKEDPMRCMRRTSFHSVASSIVIFVTNRDKLSVLLYDRSRILVGHHCTAICLTTVKGNTTTTNNNYIDHIIK
jgi:hypothetical protein